MSVLPQTGMDPLLPPAAELKERDADSDPRRKIQFSVPSQVPIQLDPRQVEMVSRHGNRDVCGAAAIGVRLQVQLVGLPPSQVLYVPLYSA